MIDLPDSHETAGNGSSCGTELQNWMTEILMTKAELRAFKSDILRFMLIGCIVQDVVLAAWMKLLQR